MSFLASIPWSSAKAVGRHALTAAGTAVAILASLGIVSSVDSAKIADALQQISVALGTLTTAILAIAGVLGPVYASWKAGKSATPAEQIKAVAANPEVAAVITTPAVADQSGPKVVSSLQEAARLPDVEPTVASAIATESRNAP